MSRLLRVLLLGSMAIALLYLLVHAREPLRLNVGDPRSDANVLASIDHVKSDGVLATAFTNLLDVGPQAAGAYRYIHDPPLAEIVYGAAGKYLGVRGIATLRLFALMFSTLAMWLLYSYVRRLYTERIALIATALFSTSLLWMTYADSIHQAPVMQCSGFLALWGLVRAIETRQRRHHAAACLGSFACFFASYDYYLFLPAAVLFTVYAKLGNPLARGNRRFVMICAAGCMLGILANWLAVIGAVGWNEFLAELEHEAGTRATAAHGWMLASALPTMIRRITFVLTPLAWIPIAYHAVTALRAPTITAALKDTAAWMLVAALAFLYVFAERAGPQMLALQVLLPFYAIGSALLIDRLLDGRTRLRRAAFGWLVAAPLWSFYFMFTQPRAVLHRDDVAKVNAYLTSHDHNDFLMSNLPSDGHLEASFRRHAWPTLDGSDPSEAYLDVLRILDLTGTDYLHAVIFTTPESRLVDTLLWPLAMPRRLWAVTGWPQLYRGKATQLIREADQLILPNLAAVGATKMLHLRDFDLYRIDRASLIELVGSQVPAVTAINLGSINANKHKLAGWSAPRLAGDEAIGVSSITGYHLCHNPIEASLPGQTAETAEAGHNACKTALGKLGLAVNDEELAMKAQLMIRVERRCGLRMTLTFAAPTLVALSMNGFRTVQGAPAKQASFLVPQDAVRFGVNLVTLEHLPGPLASSADVAALAIEPECPP